MLAGMNGRLILNIVPVSFSSEKLTIGHIRYTGEDALKELRAKYWQSHAFRFDGRTREILNVSLLPDTQPLGTGEVVDIRRHLLLAATAIQHAILLWVRPQCTILKANKELIYWGKARHALLLSQALTKVGQQSMSGLEVCLKYRLDCRMFWDTNDRPFLGLVIDVDTANVIDLPVSDLMQRGLPIIDKYVCRRREFQHPYLHPSLDLLGRVTSVQGTHLKLTDTSGQQQIEAHQALLEPRQENLEAVIRLLCGHKAARVLDELKQLRYPLTTADGKQSQIQDTLKRLRDHPLTIADGVQIQFGEQLRHGHPLFPAQISTERPTLLFGPQGRNSGPYPDAGITTWGPYMYMQHTRNTPVLAVICESRYRGRVEQFANALHTGFPDEAWTERGVNPFRGGLLGKLHLSKVRFVYEEALGPSAEHYRDAAMRLLQSLPEPPDLALVQIKESFINLRGNDNPYFVSKAVFMTAGVATQAIRIERMESAGSKLAYLLNNLALASYAKLDGIPWVISTRGPTSHELVVGIGSAEVAEGRLGVRRRYVGMTTLFQGDGRYLLWGLTREVPYEEYAQALLESLKTVIRHVQNQNGWEQGDRVRLVAHVYKRLKNCEVEAIKAVVKDLLAEKFLVEFAFLDISSSHPYHLFDPSQQGFSYWSAGGKKWKGKGIPTRGVCLQLDRSRALLHLTGPGDVKTERQGLPQPLLVELHSESDFTDLAYLVRQIYHFSFMSWKSYFPATEPVTIKYSRLIAGLLGNLKKVRGWDSTVLLGRFRGRSWFL